MPGVRVQWRGALLCGDEHPPDDVAARLEPHLRRPPGRALFLEDHGAVDPVAVTRALVRAAQSHGARVMAGTAVSALTVRGGRVVGVHCAAGDVEADIVVVAAGVDAAALCRPLGFDLPVAPSPALLMRFAAPPGLVRTIFVSPELEVREAADGELLVAAAWTGADLRQVGEETLRRIIATFGCREVRLLGVRVGQRPMPADGLPLIGPVPEAEGAYVAVMHSGVTLAPKAGRLIASELVGGVEAGELTGLRLTRHRT